MKMLCKMVSEDALRGHHQRGQAMSTKRQISCNFKLVRIMYIMLN